MHFVLRIIIAITGQRAFLQIYQRTFSRTASLTAWKKPR